MTYSASEMQEVTAKDKHDFSIICSYPSATITNWDFNKHERFGKNCSGDFRIINNRCIPQARSPAAISTSADVKDAIHQKAKAPQYCLSFVLLTEIHSPETKAISAMPTQWMGALQANLYRLVQKEWAWWVVYRNPDTTMHIKDQLWIYIINISLQNRFSEKIEEEKNLSKQERNSIPAQWSMCSSEV